MLQSERTWYILVLIGFIEVLIFVGYQFYTSLTGQNVDLVKRVDDTPISPQLGVERLQKMDSLQQNILIRDDQLN